MFADAIQTLSTMAINESNVEIPKTAPAALIEEYRAMMESIPMLSEEGSVFKAEMVPIRASKQYSKYLIEMEDLSRYMISNKVHDVRQAVCKILEANNLKGQYANTGIVIENDILSEAAATPDHFNTNDALGYGLLGKESDLTRIRQIANSKKFMDVLTGRYGLPLFRKAYSSVGLLQEAAEEEDTKIEKKDDETVLQEKDDKKDSKKSSEKECDCGKDDCEICNPKDDSKEEKKECDCGKEDCEICNPKDDDKDEDKKDKKKDKDDEDKEAGKEEQPGDEDKLDESSPFYRIDSKLTESKSTMSDHDLQIQRIRDIMAGKYDNDDL